MKCKCANARMEKEREGEEVVVLVVFEVAVVCMRVVHMGLVGTEVESVG